MIARGWTLRRTGSLVERNALIYRRSLTPVLSSILEPVLYLLSIGFGVGALVGKVYGIDVRYVDYVAPGILATTAMNAAFNQTSFAIFMRIKNDRAYDAIVPTPLSIADITLGEVASAVLSGVFASCGFVLVMLVLGLVVSPAILIAIPCSLLVGYGFASAGIAVMTFLRDFPDFQLVQLVMLPMFLFATTFYPLSVYPSWVRPLIEVLPLYQSIQLLRDPALGTFHWGMLVAALYLLVFGSVALAVATRRLGRKLLL
ncbi:MAG TPA: ABC transporter permease [Solirubrobacteraceae bacterium]|jgi:lipooligosaccharide transport system permease protein|nr:ABC transporter permease [Solirubrobacteraceae bacterium]